MAPKPAALVAALKSAPVAQDQFGGSDFPGSYLWQRGGIPAEEFSDMKKVKSALTKTIKISIRPAHIPGVKFNAS